MQEKHLILPPEDRGLTTLHTQILEGCRAVSGMTDVDFAAAFGLAAGAIPKGRGISGGTILEVEPAGREEEVERHGPVRVYAIAKDGRFLIGLRTDFEKLGLWWGKVCDVLDKRKDRQITG